MADAGCKLRSMQDGVSKDVEACDKPDESKCGSCGKTVGDQDDGVCCEICNFWYHCRCQAMSEAMYKVLNRYSEFHWFCRHCNRGAGKLFTAITYLYTKIGKLDDDMVQMRTELHADVITSATAITEKQLKLEEGITQCEKKFEDNKNDMVRMKAELHADVINLATAITEKQLKLEEGIAQCEKKVDDNKSELSSGLAMMQDMQIRIEEKFDDALGKMVSKCEAEGEIQEAHERIEQKVDALAAGVEKTAVVSDSVKEIVSGTLEEDRAEEDELQKRKTNIIIHGLLESQSSMYEKRKQEDEDTVEHLLHGLNVDDVSVDSVIRLGKRPESSDAKPRPVKIVMASEEQKIRVLSKSKNLPRNKEEGAPNIFMHQDLTPRQRMKRQELVRELKDRQAKGEKK